MVERDVISSAPSFDEEGEKWRVTRRGFIAGSAASALLADQVLGSEITGQKNRWLFSRASDGPGRYIFSITYFGPDGRSLIDLYFRERMFGALARIEVSPAGTVDELTGRIDLRLRISGATMLPEGPATLAEDPSRFFTLDFVFRHHVSGETSAPAIDVEARGWGFGDQTVLLATQDVSAWLKSGNLGIRLDERKWNLPQDVREAAKPSLAVGFLRAVFGSLIGAVAAELYLWPQTTREGNCFWRLITRGNSQDLTVATRAQPSSKDETGDALTTIASDNVLDIWRETPVVADAGPKERPVLENEPKRKPKKVESRAGWVEDMVSAAKPVSTIIRGAFRGGFRVDFRGAAAVGERLALAASRLPTEVSAGGSLAVIDRVKLVLPVGDPDEHHKVEFGRWASVDAAAETTVEIIAARAFVSGDLNIVSAPSIEDSGPQFTEGPLPIEIGQLSLSRTLTKNKVATKLASEAVEGPLSLNCRFPLAEHTFTLATSLGVYSAEAPEPTMSEPGQKRDKAPVVIRAQDFGTITHFEASVRITDASVALLDNGAASPVLGASRGHFSRLDFLGGSQVALRLHGVDEPRISLPGHILLGTTNGLAMPVEPQSSASCLPMERALLRVLRYGDLADLRFRFAGFDLVNDGTSSTLRPRGQAVVARIGDPPPEPLQVIESPDPTKAAKVKADKGRETEARAKTPVPLGKPLTGAVHDPRPMIIVEFPPQHRAEQAFFQLRTVRPGPPKLPAKVRQTRQVAEALQNLHRNYASDAAPGRQQLRANILYWLVKALPQKAGKEDWWKYEFKSLAALLQHLTVPDGTLDMDNDEGLQRQISDFLLFADSFAGYFLPLAADDRAPIDVPPVNFPAEQKLYAGSEFLDPDTQRYAELTKYALEGKAIVDGTESNTLLDKVPANPVSREEFEALQLNWGALAGIPSEKMTAAEKQKQQEAERKAAEQAKVLRELRSPGYTAFSEAYDRNVAPFVKYPDGYKETGNIPAFGGADALRGLVVDIYRILVGVDEPGADETKKEEGKKKFAGWWEGMAKALEPILKVLPKSDTGAETPTRLVQSRLSGPTRLAFRVNTDDYEEQFATGAIPFTVDALTNFSRFELSVVRRAQKLMLSHLDGTRRPVWDKEIDQDFAHMLVHQGFSRGGAALEPPDEQAETDPDLVEPPGGRRWQEARLTVDQRLAEVVKLSSDPPTELETAIEMPFRLMLSPSQDALFRTPRGVPAALYGPPNADGDQEPGASALWTAELDPESEAETRAIWSPDFRPEAFLPQEPHRQRLLEDLLTKAGSVLPNSMSRYFPEKRSRVNRAPLRGPYAPWAMGRHISSLDKTGDSKELKDHRFRTSLDAFDRHELVALSSVHGLPVLGRVSLSGARIGKDQREPPPGFQVSLLGRPTDDTEPYDLSDIYVPRPLDRQGFELALSSLGGFLSVNASFEPPASIIDYERGSLFDALSIERWRHRIVLGRDISAEVVYKGYLMPFGIRASLIKSTERRFERIEGKGGPVAVLRQRMFIRIAKPLKEFGAFRQPDDGRRVPFRKVRIVTVQTPDIVDPFDLGGTREQTGVWPGGLIDLVARDPTPYGQPETGNPFWPRTARRAGAEVMFEVLLDDKIRVRMPMVFVDNVTVNRAVSLALLVDYYNLHGQPLDKLADVDKQKYAPYVARGALVQRPLFSQKLIFAPPENDGDTEFETETVTFAVEGGRPDGYRDTQNGNAETYQPVAVNRNFGNNPYLNGADQPPFYPAMRRAVVHVKQIERLTGQANVPVVVGYDTTYALKGFDPPPQPLPQGEAAPPKNNRSDIFLALLKPLPMRFGDEGQRGGAVARPQIDVVALSRSRGPIGSMDAAKTELGTDSPAGVVPQNAAVPTLPEIPPRAHQVKGADLADFFGDDAKLLGIVRISDLLKVLGKLFDLEPKLREIREFGGGVADDTDAFIRDKVLTPLRNALVGFTERLRNLQFDNKSGIDALKDVYPEVSQTMVAFVALLDRAISAAPPSTDTDATIELYSAVYSTGRRFAQAVERVSRDPLTPLREALRGLVTGFVNELSRIVTEVTGEFRKNYSAKNVRLWAIELLQQNLLIQNGATTALANVIIRLPLPGSKALADAVQESVDKAYASTLLMAPDTNMGGTQKAPWSAEPDLPLFDLKTFGETFFEKLKKEVENNAALKIWAENEERAIRASLDRLEGALWGRFHDIVVTRLSDATKVLAGVSVLSVENLVQAFEVIGAAFAEGFSELRQMGDIAQEWNAQCLNLIAVADSFARVIFPRLVVDPKVCIGDTADRNWVQCNDPAAFPPFYRMVGAVVRLADALQVLGDTTSGKLKKLIEKVDKASQDDAVTAALQPLKEFLVKLSASGGKLSKDVGALRGELLLIANDFNDLRSRYDAAYKDAASLCGEPAKLVRTLYGTLAQLERRRSDAITQLKLLAGLLKGAVPVLLPAEDSGTPPLVVPPTSVKPAIDGSPKDWAWSDVTTGELSNPQAAIYFIETARKDILAAVLRPLTLAADFLADATTLASLVTVQAGTGKAAFDQQRDTARTELLTALSKIPDTLFGKLFASLSKALSKPEGNVPAPLNAIVSDIETAITKLRAAETVVANFENEAVRAGAIAAVRTDLLAQVDGLEKLADKVVDSLIKTASDQLTEVAQGLENQILGALSRIIGSVNVDLRSLLQTLQTPLMAITSATAKAFDDVRKQRDGVIDSMTSSSAALNASLTTFLVACPTDLSNAKNDLLAAQTAALQVWAKTIAQETPGSDRSIGAVAGFLDQIKTWTRPDNVDAKTCTPNSSEGPNAVVVIFQQVRNAIETVVRGEFGKLIDIAAVKREVEAKLRELIPTRLTLAYDFDVELKQDVAEIFIPNHQNLGKYFNPEFENCRLTLKARTYIDLLKPSVPKVDVSGAIGAFKIKLVGSTFDVLTLQFDGARFGSETGGKLKTNVTDFKLGKMVEFLDSISQWVSFGENGFFLALRWDLPGIEVGYRMPPIYLTLGGLNISNVSLNASCVLPFSDGSALFKVGLSRPEAPFSITSTIFGGCGHLALYADPSGIIGFSASLEFGAIVDFKLGPVTGMGRITAGVYIRSIDMGGRRVSTIEGIFTAAGSAKIAMFSIMAMLQVRVGQQASGGVAGSAIFVFSFSLGIKDIEFRFVIFKQEGKGFGGGGLTSLESPTRFASQAIDQTTTEAVSDWTPWTSGNPKKSPKVSSSTTCKSKNFAGYMNHFSEARPWILS